MLISSILDHPAPTQPNTEKVDPTCRKLDDTQVQARQRDLAHKQFPSFEL